MLTLKNKADIYDLLVQGFKPEEKIPLATLALYLNTKKFSYGEYGYKKLKSLLGDLEFLSFETSPEKNNRDGFVIIHAFDGGKKKVVKVAKKKEKLSEEDRSRLISLLTNHFETGKKYPFSTVSLYLVENGIDYKALGYSKMKQLMGEFNTVLTLSPDEKDPSQCNITINAVKKEKKKAEPKKGTKQTAIKEEPKKTVKAKEKPLPLPSPKKGCFFIPSNLILSTKDFTNLGLDNDSIIDLILKDYEKAFRKKDFRLKEDAYIFSLSFKGKDGDSLIASIKKAGKGAPYAYYINFIGSDKEKPKDYLADRIYFSDYSIAIEELAQLARKEKWCYHNSKDKNIILKIYLQYTFYRIVTQKKLMVSSDQTFACFNTGLKTEEYEDIYCVLRRSNDRKIAQEYLYEGFSIAGNQGLGKTIVEHFNPLPEKATYISSADELIFSNKGEIITDKNHVILDNLDRFPITFLSNMMLPFKEEKKILDQIIKEKNEFAKDKLFTKLEKLVAENNNLLNLLNYCLRSTIDKAVRMVNYDYRNALPSFFQTRDVMSLMLPLEFTAGKVEAVLLIEKTASGNYQGQTILTLKQCYVNARLIGPLENSFLNPSKIDD